jgi:hypothetical protein
MNRYLEKIALTRAVKEFAKGRITSTAEDLITKGVFRSDKTYAKGMQVGNEVLAKKLGAHIQRARGDAQKAVTGQMGGYGTMPSSKGDVIFHDKHVMGLENSNHQGMIRHELFESMEAKEKRKLGNQSLHINREEQKAGITDGTRFLDGTRDIKTSNKLIRLTGHMEGMKPTVFQKDDNLVGMHFSPRVLTRESEMVRKNPHTQGLFKHIRGPGITSESTLIKRITGKSYGSDKMTGKDFHRANTATPDTHIEAWGAHNPSFITNK